MTVFPTILTILMTAALFAGSSEIRAQQQYDSLGSPTPAPNQNASPATPSPNIPTAGNDSGGAAGGSMNNANSRTNAGTKGTSYTTGAGADKMPTDTTSKGSTDGTINTGTTTPTDPTTNGGATPNGLTPD